jgi:transposase
MKRKYVSMDVHFATILSVVLDFEGKKVMETVLRTEAGAIRDYLKGMSGPVWLTFEEGTMAAWLYEIVEPLVEKVIVCNPRRNRLLKSGSKSDKIDAEKLAELLRLGALKPVYHKRHEVGELKQFVAIYCQLTGDRTRVMNRLRAIFRSESLRMTLKKEKREEMLARLASEAARERAGLLFEELEALDSLQVSARKKMTGEAKKHPDYGLLQTMPGISRIRAAQLLAWGVTPHRFRTKRRFWSYCGLSVVTRSTADHEVRDGRIVARRRKAPATRGLTKDYHHGLKGLFKGAALDCLKNKEIRPVYERLLARGLNEAIARVQLARKLAAGCLAIWKSGKEFDNERLIQVSDKK